MKQKLTLLASFLGLLTFAQSGSEQIIQENPDLGAEVDYILENLELELSPGGARMDSYTIYKSRNINKTLAAF